MADSFQPTTDSFVSLASLKPAPQANAPAPQPEMGMGESLRQGFGLGALADTLPGHSYLGIGRPEARTPVDVVLNPEGAAEQAASAAVSAVPVAGVGLKAAKMASSLAPVARAAIPAAARAL